MVNNDSPKFLLCAGATQNSIKVAQVYHDAYYIDWIFGKMLS